MEILVVDSSVQIIERWQQLLSENKNIKTVYGAVAYLDALKLFKKIHPDVVLLDSRLNSNGTIELLKAIKADAAKTKVIVMTNWADEHLKTECREFGVDLFFDKYNEFEKVPGVIERIAATRSMSK